jgi:hypothetical protein
VVGVDLRVRGRRGHGGLPRKRCDLCSSPELGYGLLELDAVRILEISSADHGVDVGVRSIYKAVLWMLRWIFERICNATIHPAMRVLYLHCSLRQLMWGGWCWDP